MIMTNRFMCPFKLTIVDFECKNDKLNYSAMLYIHTIMRMLRIVITSPRTWLAAIGDFYDEEDGSTEEPEWVANEKDNFNNVLDKNGDGRLDNAEVGQWVLPRDLEYVADEAKHLLSSADENQVRSQCVVAAGCSFYVP